MRLQSVDSVQLTKQAAICQAIHLVSQHAMSQCVGGWANTYRVRVLTNIAKELYPVISVVNAKGLMHFFLESKTF